MDENYLDSLLHAPGQASDHKIIYCKPCLAQSVLPGIVETQPNNIPEDVAETLEIDEIAHIHSLKNLQQKQVFIEQNVENSGLNDDEFQRIPESLLLFIMQLRAFRGAMAKNPRKKTTLSKYITLLVMWSTEMQKGYFTMEDWMQFRRTKTREFVKIIFERLLKNGLIVEYQMRRYRKNGVHCWLLSSKTKLTLLTQWAHYLGGRIPIKHLRINSEWFKQIRLENGMEFREMARVLGITETQVYRIENGCDKPGKKLSERILDRFYYHFSPIWWPEWIKREIDEGKRPRWQAIELNKFRRNHFKIVRNADQFWREYREKQRAEKVANLDKKN